jgi:putative Flp pilus-assembly TadE/G-like protein
MARAFRTEDGAVAVMVAALLPLVVLLLAFAIDASHWWVHKRHLQAQVDAGVFAGAFASWLPGCAADPGGTDNTIVENARRYAGDYSSLYAGPVPPFNEQYSNATNVHVLVNADKFESQGGEDYSVSGAASPCESFMSGEGHLDLKASERGLPGLFSGIVPGLDSLPFLSSLANAHARVQLFRLSSGAGYLPVGVPDPNPKAGAAFFIDEQDGTIISNGRVELLRGSPAMLNGKSLVEWASDPSGHSVTVRPKTGVVIAFSGRTNWTWQSGDLQTICQQALVECYQGLDEGPWKGLAYVHGYDAPGANAVTVGDVQLTNGSCGDDSAPYFILHGNCTVGFKAQVDFPVGSNPSTWQVSVENSDMGCSGQQPPGCALTLAGDGYWTGDGVLTVPVQGRALDLRVNWRYRLSSGGGQQSGGAVVARVYSADDLSEASGPVEYLRVYDPGTGADRHSAGTQATQFAVKVGLQGALEFQTDALASPTRIRVIRNRQNASQNQSLDCDPDYDAFLDKIPDFADELWRGCRPSYTINSGETCPSSPATLWASAQPWPCVAVETGQSTNKVPKGLNHRILGEEQPQSCPAAGEFGHNNWNLNGDSVPDYQPGDPRLLFTFVTPFGSFQGSGQTTIPVTNVAVFYITGWTGQGQGFSNPCEGNGDDPAPGPAYIVGHFVKYAGTLPGGGEGTENCVYDPTDPGSITPCVAVLTD